MAQSTILAAGQTAATSTDIVIASGATVTVTLFTTSASVKIPPNAAATIFLDSPSADVPAGTLSGVSPATQITGPGTYRISRHDITGYGVDVGISLES